MSKKSLQQQQLSQKMQVFAESFHLQLPTGWVKSIRSALGISAQQLGKKLNISRQGVQDMERREKDGSITIKSLREAAKALDMHLVYGFVPVDGSLEKLIDRKAKVLATQIVLRTHNTMKLEDQANTNKRIAKAIEELTTTLKTEMPKTLWD
ncbi:MAG: mobile mystery protein A [Cyclobacteriaceae bacterium]|nr:mobile mystery protein A [Cyclobacteriaceae bacterium]